jgi:hypothetical protein
MKFYQSAAVSGVGKSKKFIATGTFGLNTRFRSLKRVTNASHEASKDEDQMTNPPIAAPCRNHELNTGKLSWLGIGAAARQRLDQCNLDEEFEPGLLGSRKCQQTNTYYIRSTTVVNESEW